jgi:hypothetical protein
MVVRLVEGVVRKQPVEIFGKNLAMNKGVSARHDSGGVPASGHGQNQQSAAEHL